jgi:hypothetical protein
MADWLILLLHVGGVIGIVAVAMWITGKWLLKQITTTLTSYLAAYAQETAKIDARMERLQLLAEEQARLTRTVETIKDEIAAQAKSRDNRWAFRKDVYVSLLKATTELLHEYDGLQEYHRQAVSDDDAEIQRGAEQLAKLELIPKMREFYSCAYLAPLATADEIVAPIEEARKALLQCVDDPLDQQYQGSVSEIRASLRRLVGQLQQAGRKDLWGNT